MSESSNLVVFGTSPITPRSCPSHFLSKSTVHFFWSYKHGTFFFNLIKGIVRYNYRYYHFNASPLWLLFIPQKYMVGRQISRVLNGLHIAKYQLDLMITIHNHLNTSPPQYRSGKSWFNHSFCMVLIQ